MPEGTLSISRSGYYGDMCNVADTSQCLATETVRRHGSEVVKATDLTRRKAFTNYLHIFTLANTNNK